MDYAILARGVERWEFDIFEWAETVPRPLAVLVMVLMQRMGLVTMPGGKGGRGHGSVRIAWDTASMYFQVGGPDPLIGAPCLPWQCWPVLVPPTCAALLVLSASSVHTQLVEDGACLASFVVLMGFSLFLCCLVLVLCARSWLKMGTTVTSRTTRPFTPRTQCRECTSS
jgi:hypothetical protein